MTRSDEAPAVSIRRARRVDVAALVALVIELASFERAEDQVEVTEEILDDVLFGSSPTVHAHVAECDGAIAGMAIWFVSYSTWTGRHGIFLEDLYVRPAFRRMGAASALLAELAATATASGWTRFEWRVLDWNVDARRFYESLGAVELDEWMTCRLSGEALGALAAKRRAPVSGIGPGLE